MPTDRHCPGLGQYQTRNNPDKRRFSRPVRPQESKYLTGLNSKEDIRQRKPVFLGIFVCYVVKRDQKLSAHTFPPSNWFQDTCQRSMMPK